MTDEAMRRLRIHSATPVEPGLTATEIGRIEEEFGFRFAADHRAFLTAGLPVGGKWPDWRNGDRATLRRSLDAPVEGVLFDIEQNSFWYGQWPSRPADTAAAVARASELLLDVPALVPVYAHRYLPAGPTAAGHPVLSVSQTDVIVYGNDLADYIDREFGDGGSPEAPKATVPFWRDLIS